jgi:hypothetical protein
MLGLRTSDEGVGSRPSGHALDPSLPGHFVSPEFQADTARFLEEVKARIGVRLQAEQPSHTIPRLGERA